MLRSNAQSYAELRRHLDNVPVIETHEHHENFREFADFLGFIFSTYYRSDFESAGGDPGVFKGLSQEERYKEFLRIYKKSDKTAYARGMQEAMRLCWGVDGIDSLEDFKALEENFAARDASVYETFMEKMKIKAKVVNLTDISAYVDGKETGYSQYCRFALPLPPFHDLHGKNDLMKYQKYLGRPVKSLADYLESFDMFLKKCMELGVVCIKDQTAYRRAIAYGNPTRDEAEKVFNDMIFNPRDVFGDDRVRPLDDWLFQYAMRAAAKHDLPVQLHTGHMAAIWNEIAKTNAAHLIPTLELHRDVRFDLFHGNWPYMDEYLFIGKNYPNAYLDLCWVQSIDPLYCIELMKRAVMTVPHNKVFAFGGDTIATELTVGYLSLARDNVACALSELVDSGWLDMGEARQIAADWFFNNPNEFFKLGFQPV